MSPSEYGAIHPVDQRKGGAGEGAAQGLAVGDILESGQRGVAGVSGGLLAEDFGGDGRGSHDFRTVFEQAGLGAFVSDPPSEAAAQLVADADRVEAGDDVFGRAAGAK